MKNFRKVLALVLVVATLFSFAAMASAKSLADYKDADKVTYTAAVEVLSALEILNGYEDGSFKPTNNISREEMAKMIAVMANAGDADVDSLYAAACEFADVEKTRWSASYISYCAYTGIVAGVGENCFNPYGNVTAVETAKMLLVLMGFDADEQGYVGANWKINVLRDAQNFGLTAGFPADYDWNKAITRELAAQMMLNALRAPVIVGVLSENIVKITNALYAEYKYDVTLIDAQKYGWLKMYGNVIVDGDTTLGEALYDGRLYIDEDAIDCYGRPGTYWYLEGVKGNVILSGSFIPETPIAKNTDGTIDVAKTVAAASSVKEVVDLDVYIDGNPAELADVAAGKGIVIEVYANGAGTEITVVEINTYIGQIHEVNLAKGTFSITGADEADAAYAGSYKNTFGFVPADKGQVVLYWPCGETDGLHDCKIIAPEVHTINRADKYPNGTYTFVADGKTYDYAANYFNYIYDGKYYVGEDGDDAHDLGVKHDIYFDEFGYVMFLTDTITETVEFAVVKEGSKRADSVTWVNEEAVQPFYASFIPFAADTTAVEKVTGTNLNNQFNYLFDSEADTLVMNTLDEAGNIVDVDLAYASEQMVNLNKGSAEVSGMQEYITENTQFIVRVKNYGTGVDEYKYFDGLDAIDASYVSDAEDLSFQYFLDGTGRYFTHVYVKATYAVEAHRAFVLGLRQNTILMTDGSMVVGGNQYNAIVNGEEAIVIYERDMLRELPMMVKSEWVCIGLTIDDIPVYARAHEDTASKLQYCPFHEIRVEGNVITWVEDCDHIANGEYDCFIPDIEGAQVAADALIMVVYPVSGGYKAVKMTSAEFDAWRAEWGWAQGNAYVSYAGGKITELVVLATAIEDKP